MSHASNCIPTQRCSFVFVAFVFAFVASLLVIQCSPIYLQDGVHGAEGNGFWYMLKVTVSGICTHGGDSM